MSRRPRDYYPTPPWCLRRLAESVDLGRLGAPEPPPAPMEGPLRLDAYHGYHPEIGSAWEPAAGRGHLAGELVGHLPDDCTTGLTDIEPYAERGVAGHDFLAADPPAWAHEVAPELIITNPPYCAANAFVRRALELVADHGAVVMLLRITWLGGALDAHPGHWLHEHPPAVYVLPERPGFMGGGGGDSSPSAWCIWRRELLPHLSACFRVLGTTPVEERRADEAAVAHEGLPSRQTSLFEEAV